MKRRAIWIAVLIACVAIAVLVWTVQSGLAEQPADPDGPSSAGIPTRPADAFPLTVASVWDGDTLRATVLTPNDLVTTTDEVRIRLIGIDTPEVSPEPECWSLEAKDALLGLLPVGSTVWAAPDVDPLDRYDRWLFNLWTDDGRFVNYELVAAGAGESLLVRPNGAYIDLLRDAEASARASAAGRWGACD